MNIRGDLHVMRTGNFDRRANQGLISKTLTATLGVGDGYQVIVNDYSWLRLDGGAVDQVVTMPAATSLTTGWKIVVENYGTTNPISVVDNAAGVLKGLTYAPSGATEGAAYEFTLVDNSTAAGIWYVVELGDPTSGGILAQRVVANFATIDWSAAVNDYRTLDKTIIARFGADQGAGGHGRGVAPMYIVQELDGTSFDRTICDKEIVSSVGDLALRVTDGAEFAGRVVLV